MEAREHREEADATARRAEQARLEAQEQADRARKQQEAADDLRRRADEVDPDVTATTTAVEEPAEARRCRRVAELGARPRGSRCSTYSPASPVLATTVGLVLLDQVLDLGRVVVGQRPRTAWVGAHRLVRRDRKAHPEGAVGNSALAEELIPNVRVEVIRHRLDALVHVPEERLVLRPSAAHVIHVMVQRYPGGIRFAELRGVRVAAPSDTCRPRFRSSLTPATVPS